MESYDSYVSHNVSLRELDTAFVDSQVVAPFCISWSRDNKVSLVVEGGIFTYELWSAPLSNQQKVTFFRSWIPACTNSPLSSVVNNDNGAFLWNLERKQAFETCVDSTLSYAVQKPNATFGVSQIIQCEFSPLIGSKSYISCLTNHGLLEIYKNTLKKWIPVINITQLWISHCNRSCLKENQQKSGFQTFKSEMYKLKINTMKWVEKPEITFITGHANGEIVFWKVDIMNENFGMSVRFSCNVNGKPSCLHLCSLPNFENSFLFIGKLCGVVQCLPVNFRLEVNHENFDLWENEDFLCPNIIDTKFAANKLFVFSIKQHILLIQTLSVKNIKKLQLLETQWEEFPTTITGWNEYQNSFIICLKNHDLFILNIKYNKAVIEYEKKPVDMEVKKKQKNSYCCYGLTMSLNKAIWIIASSSNQNYDSLKEITYLVMYSPIIKVFRSLTDTTSSGLIEQIMETYTNIQLNEIFDLLELKKLELLLDFTKFRNNYEIKEDLPLLQFQVLLWELKLKLLCNFADIDSLITNIEYLITKKRAKKVIHSLQKCKSLSGSQKRSLDVCQMFLMNVIEKGKSLNEACCICDCEAFCYNIRILSCSNLHKFPRCCLSLLPCDVAPYAICKICQSVALIRFVKKDDNRCPYCDGLLECDTRFHSGV